MALHNLTEATAYFNEVMERVNAFGSPVIALFRGLGKSEYDLKSNVSRKIIDAKKLRDQERQIISSFDCYTKCLERKGIMVKKNFDNEFHNQWHFLAQMQHLEIPTRLMDWTMRWEIALLFAVCNKSNDGADGAIFIIKMPRARYYGPDDVSNFDPFNLNDSIMINVEIVATDYESYMKRTAERRRARQHGRFFVQSHENSVLPMETNPHYNGFLERVIIPSGSKEQIRNELENKNLNEKLAMVEKNKHVEQVKNRVLKCSPRMNKFFSTFHL